MFIDDEQLIGIVPAGGLGKRMYPFKVWKELIPVGYKKVCIGSEERTIPKVLAEYTIDNMVKGGVRNILFIINNYKTELMRVFGDGKSHGVNIAYLNQDLDSGFYAMPIALDLAYPFVKDKTVFMGMPDTIVEPDYCFKRLLENHRAKKADLSIGVFPTDCPTRLAPVVIDAQGYVKAVYDKPKTTDIFNTWNIAIWSPAFTELIHRETQKYIQDVENQRQELLLSDLFNMAVEEGLEVVGICFEEGRCRDLGKIDEFVETRRELESPFFNVINSKAI